MKGGPEQTPAPEESAGGSRRARRRLRRAARAAAKPPAPRRSLFQSLRNNFLTGLIVVAPIGITLFLTWTIVDYVDQQVLPQVLPLIPEEYHPDNFLPFSLPGLGLLVFILFLTFVGGIAKNFFGRELIRIGESWVDRMPVVRSVYNALKQITETIFADSGASFDKACLIEYPRRGVWAIAFVATDTKGEVRERAAGDGEMVSVFLPTTPNPTSGFLLFIPKEDVVFLDMTLEEAAKLVISGGLITPPHRHGGEEGESGETAEAGGASTGRKNGPSLERGEPALAEAGEGPGDRPRRPYSDQF